MRKLHLLEEDENIVANEDKFTASNLISTLIKTEWDSVDLYNSILLTISNEGIKDVDNILNDIISNHYIHIGQLEKALQYVNNDAMLNIEDGKDIADDVLD